MKIVNRLVTDGFVEGLRGKGGGIRLKRSPAEICVGDVIRRMEPGFDLVDCFQDESACLLSAGCRLKKALRDALEAFLASLDAVMLADLLVNPPRLREQLSIPLVLQVR